MKNTSPLIDYYRGASLLVEFDGEQPIEQVTANLLVAVEALK
jgi:adenylate kinase family enzyme